MKSVYFDVAWPNVENDEFLSRISRQTPKSNGVWQNVKAVSTPDAADIHVAFNCPSQGLNEDKLILFCKEPPCLTACDGWDRINTLKQFPIEEFYMPQDWWLDRSYDELNSMEPMTKTKDLSWITSDKGRNMRRLLRMGKKFFQKLGYKHRKKPLKILNNPTDGHILRMNFLDELISDERLSDTLDLYGRGDFSGDYYKGVLPSKYDKWDGLAEYRYSIVVENYHGKNYFSEKITDALLSWCMPIYWGCTNLPKFLPEDCFIQLDIEEDGAERILEIIESRQRENNLGAIAKARSKLLNQYQIWPTVKSAVDDIYE